ncbi:DUF418 domain-containing protein [Natranaerobius thermophilus]|uniref:DUF418 domain-containing protein n=1 Tax=Natranaerobius thermophilus (strain ATCC BAA-1301 / DSM 18059 / JW/NM-WN-LF) TaxID=457570 RepID=B2A4W1_NATTJ|nr:DUF418 domain-containing protein [Natranaerobius thermophilus]ACB83883.1 protein of unknown function DUF418 [Natranaerobius thermophilus JW/NM-WN-LF]
MVQRHGAPTDPNKRVEIVDIIRGFALFGVLLVNMTLFKSTLFYWEQIPHYSGDINVFFGWMIELLATGKFYPIFSFLFGLGFYFFVSRAQKKGLKVGKLYRRRILGLLIFGLIHLVFIWSGDILHLYSVGGLFLLVFSTMSDKTIKKLMVFFFCLAVIIQGGIVFAETLTAEEDLTAEIDPREKRLQLKEDATGVYQEGDFLDILRFRVVNEVPYVMLNILLSLPDILFLFLLGLYAGRKKIFMKIGEYRQKFRWTLNRTLPIGVIGTLVYYLIMVDSIGLGPIAGDVLAEMIFYVASISLAVTYICSLSLLSQYNFPMRILSPLSNVGKMALTNYLTQSLISVSIFYGYGAGLFEQVSVTGGVAITVGIYTLQMIWSWIWMSRFRFGPFEWLWRSFTYQEFPPIKLSS